MVAKGVLQILRREVQGPEGEHERKREDDRPDATRRPAAKHVRRQVRQQHQQDPRCGRIRERQLHPDKAQRLRVGVHSVAELLEDHCQEGSWNVQDASLHVLHNQLLEPVFHKRGSVGAADDARDRARIERRNVQQLVLECTLLPDDTNLVRRQAVIHLEAFELTEDQCVQQAAQTHNHVFQLLDLLVVGIRIPGEGSESRSPLDPVGSHVMYQATALPVTGNCMGSSEDDQETHQTRQTSVRGSVEKRFIPIHEGEEVVRDLDANDDEGTDATGTTSLPEDR